MESLSISKTEELLSKNIFARMADIPLVDRYEAYQLLDDDWTKIAVDLEIIQTEGFGATKIVDANMVVKKKGNVEQEVQEGWKGRIIPFDLIQSTILADDKQALSEKENRLSEIASEYEEILDTLSEEEKEADFVNEDSWVFAEIKKAMKSDGVEPETKEKLKSVSELNTEEKALKTAIKRDNALLEEKTKDTIEHLSDEQVLELLKDKWIKPLIDNLMQLPDSIISDLVSKLEALAKKYETTFADVENQIEETEKSLSSMIDDLEGSEFDMQGLAELKKLLGGSAK
jgi:type I restriction enzyme M protein